MAALIPSASASGSGTMTLSGPITNSNQTITIPDATGTMMVSGNMPAFSVYASANQSISHVTNTKLTFDTEEFDTNNNFASNRFTPTVAGYYQINGFVLWNTGTSTQVGFCSIYKNGSEFKRGNQIAFSSGNNIGCSATAVIYFNGSTDYVELYVWQNNGAAILVIGGSSFTYFTGALVRAA